jgi:hypothetical protein
MGWIDQTVADRDLTGGSARCCRRDVGNQPEYLAHKAQSVQGIRCVPPQDPRLAAWMMVTPKTAIDGFAERPTL